MPGLQQTVQAFPALAPRASARHPPIGPSSGRDLVERDVLQGTQDEDLAIVGGQLAHGVGQKTACSRREARSLGEERVRGQGVLNGQARALQQQVERLLPLVIAPLAAVVFDLVGQRRARMRRSQATSSTLTLTGEAREIAVGLQKRLLDQVRRLEL